MKIIAQVAKNASVLINQEIKQEIKFGYVLFVAFSLEDNFFTVDKMINNLLKLRIFPDQEDKLNLTILDVKGEILSISQFTLYADLSKGNRPSFSRSLEFQQAKNLYDYFNKELAKSVVIKTGIFGSNMEVTLSNCGPITIILDSNEI